jgi:hypothetical protein
MTSIVHQPFFEVGVDGLQPFLVSLALSLVALSTFSTIGRVVIGRRRGEKWTGQAFSLMATVSGFTTAHGFFFGGAEAETCLALCTRSHGRPNSRL